MTVHKSKGLEFPVVILAGCGAPFSNKTFTEPLLFHRSVGCASALFDPESGETRPSVLLSAVTDAVRDEEREEEIRNLYVGLTRARERLYVTRNPARKERQRSDQSGSDFLRLPHADSRRLLPASLDPRGALAQQCRIPRHPARHSAGHRHSRGERHGRYSRSGAGRYRRASGTDCPHGISPPTRILPCAMCPPRRRHSGPFHATTSTAWR